MSTPDEDTGTVERAGTKQAAQLIRAAKGVYANAYAPYSNYRVAAAVLADNGEVYTGCNVENAVYPLTICAERVAIFKAIAAGARAIEAIAVVTANGGSPCGSCRQVMREFADDTMPIYVADTTGAHRTYTMRELLPAGFSAADLVDCPTDGHTS